MIPLNENMLHLTPSAIRRFSALAKTVPDCVMLTLGEPDGDTPKAIRDAAIAAINNNETHYAANQGSPALREAIAEFETKRGMPTTAEQVIVTVGATEALSVTMEGVLNPGDEVIVFTPAYPLYQSLATMAGAKCVFVPLAENGFQLTKEAMEAAISEKTRAVVLNSPNNPTGTVLNRESLAILRDAIVGKPIWLVCDQVYDQLIYGDVASIATDSALKDQRIVCQSFSKPYAMTGWRIGYLVAPAEVTAKLLLLHAARVSCLPTFLQSACIEALKTDVSASVEVYRKRRDFVLSRLDQMGLRYPMPEGAFYVFVDVSKFGMDAETFCTRMIQEAAVATVPGTCFGAEGFIRLSYCCSMENLEKAMDRMEKFLQTL